MEERKQRVKRLKKIIVFLFFFFLLMPSVLCIILMVKVTALEHHVTSIEKENKDEINSLKAIIEELTGSHNDLSDEVKDVKERAEVTEEEAEEGYEKRKVYLTFDDGPSSSTEEILEILDRYNVKATFFVTGMNVPRYDEIYKKIIDKGHTLGLHTYTHEYKEIYGSLEGFKEDFLLLQDHIEELTGEHITVYRFPGGSGNAVVNAENRREIMTWLEEQGVEYYDWNVSAQDAQKNIPSASEIVEACMSEIKKRDTSIVLMHDAGAKKSTIEALPHIIEEIQMLGDAEILPIDENTAKIQQITLTKE